MQLPGRYVVVFDNNAYGDLIEGKPLAEVDAAIARLRSDEMRHGAHAVASPLVMMELVALLDDPAAAAYDRAYMAIIALWEHTKVPVGGELRIGLFTDPTSMVCQQLFGVSPTKNQETLDLIAQTCTHIGRDRPDHIEPEVKQIIHAVAEHVRQTEERFVKEIYELVVRPMNPSTEGWAPLRGNREAQAAARRYLASEDSRIAFGQMQLDNCLEALDKTLSKTEQIEASRFLAKKLVVAATLFNEILGRIVTAGCNLEKRNRRNWVWDLYLALGIGADHSVQNKGIHLVTTDRDILTAAEVAGCKDIVYSYATHRSRIAA